MKSPKITIKSILVKNLMESNEPFFYLAPNVVGSINNAYSTKKKKLFVVDFNTVDDLKMKLVVPFGTYSNFCGSNVKSDSMPLKFLNTFLQDVKRFDNSIEPQEDGMLDEMVDEFGEIYDDSDDLPANIQGAPGYYNKRSGEEAEKQYTTQYTRLISPLGYGGVVW